MQTHTETHKREKKAPLHFTMDNILMVKNLLGSGLTYRQCARRLNSNFVTAVKHRKVTEKTIANILQSERQLKIETSLSKMPLEEKIKEVLTCNLKRDLKLQLLADLI